MDAGGFHSSLQVGAEASGDPHSITKAAETTAETAAASATVQNVDKQD